MGLRFGSMSLQAEVQRLGVAGALRIYGKALAANDNSKNQVYFGSSLASLNLIPAREVLPPDPENPEILKAPLDWYWLTESGAVANAPNAQLILYPDYPEVRLSGFLLGCKVPPSKLMASRLEGRVLLIGIRADDSIIGHALAPASVAAKEFIHSEGRLPHHGVFAELPLQRGRTGVEAGFVVLAERLAEIHRRGWIRSWRMGAQGERLDCEAPQCGGYTLEAELGVRPNGRSEPDFLGWELKHFAVNALTKPMPESKVLTLMTPEPTGGLYRDDFDKFLADYGYADRSGREGREGRRNFGGVHKCGDTPHHLTGLSLVLEGYDRLSRTPIASGCLALVDERGTRAATWSFAHLMEKWSRKHDSTVYVPGEMRTEPDKDYRYGSTIAVGRGTDFIRFLDGLAAGKVYLDPGVKQAVGEKLKKRNQFRARFGDLDGLYAAFSDFNVAGLSPQR